MEFGNYHFLDLHKGGDNGFADHEYGDFDHLNYAGSRRLSRTIAQTLERVCAEALPLPQTVSVGIAQTPLIGQGQDPHGARNREPFGKTRLYGWCLPARQSSANLGRI
jgi:hypothetical protein